MERGFAFSGHTDFLEHLCNSQRAVMAFVGGELRVALVTTHVPLMQVGDLLNPDDIVRVVTIVAQALQRDLGLQAPRIAVCGLNPHAGEEGALGQEELETIGPACETLRQNGHAIHGPVSAETAFLGARNGRYDVLIAMYHDQGLAPLKAVDFGRSVNWTLGLPMVRTSVDHGTADDLVGRDCADPASMQAALRLARSIVARRDA
jgi:4-hydroxythreonine-4-phosphate dehydrogenase